MVERELKAVVPSPALVRAGLTQAGALPGFNGLMTDQRFDRDGALLARDQVLRVRHYHENNGVPRVRLTWKGPVAVDPEGGYKLRPEIELEADGQSEPALALIQALGYRQVQAVDRWVEYYRLGGATARLEWYPRMDVLIEVEGDRAAIEAAVAASGLPRTAFSAESLPAFVARYESRTGHRAAIALAELDGEQPSWHRR